MLFDRNQKLFDTKTGKEGNIMEDRLLKYSLFYVRIFVSVRLTTLLIKLWECKTYNASDTPQLGQFKVAQVCT
jgi:hypothetical protein